MKLIRLWNRNRNKPLHTIVDDEDYDFLMQWKWRGELWRGTYYVNRNVTDRLGKKTRVHMHRVIMGLETFDRLHEVDHLNGMPLDNRKENLQICETCENQRNRGPNKNTKSGVKGVCWHKSNRKWQVAIGFNRIVIPLGCYGNIEEAARVRRDAEIILYSQSVPRNTPISIPVLKQIIAYAIKTELS